ncbi:MAG: methyltransferase domain-containing protein [Rhodospirillaceae bacterium]
MTSVATAADHPRLHLGCGERHLPGYVNIDFPPAQHTVQRKSVADQHADICGLVYRRESIAEVRLHHVFEHFRRPTACALLAVWHSWLAPGGRLHVEVPDLFRSLLVICNPLRSARRKAVAERHLFGSHEAPWAAHYEAYTSASLRRAMEAFGYTPIRTRRHGWRGTFNVEVMAEKRGATRSANEYRAAARRYLADFLVDDTPGELALLDVWMRAYDEQFARGYASD